jgi:hypothetical protein
MFARRYGNGKFLPNIEELTIVYMLDMMPKSMTKLCSEE